MHNTLNGMITDSGSDHYINNVIITPTFIYITPFSMVCTLHFYSVYTHVATLYVCIMESTIIMEFSTLLNHKYDTMDMIQPILW